MKFRNNSVKAIFFKKMSYSAILQFFVLGILLIFTRSYLQHSQLDAISNKLLVRDSFTTEEIGRYYLLNNKYAIDLALYNLENERKLDSIKFTSSSVLSRELGVCKMVNNYANELCKTDDGIFSGITPIKINKKIIGYIIAKKHYTSMFALPISYGLLLILLMVVGILIFNFLFLFISMKKKIENNTKILLDIISPTGNPGEDFYKIDIEEYSKIAQKFLDERSEIEKLQQEKTYYQVRRNIAEQVAHDIRSPLAVINTGISDISTLPEKKRLMIKNAAKRINDIANNLLFQSKDHIKERKYTCNDKNSPELIFIILDSIVSEKKYEYSDMNLTLEFDASEDSYSCFSDINIISFKRVLSNLINNSVESLNTNGFVKISLKCENNLVFITIADNGCGIPSEIIPKVMEHGFSYGKKKGDGYGLSYAKYQIEKLNGEISIQSELNVGTQVTIQLAKTTSPSWFCERLSIQPNMTIGVLDDDPSIHDAWEERLSSIPDITILHFSKAFELKASRPDHLTPALYLVDYELLGDTQNGLEIIEELQLSQKSILVTSAFEDDLIRAKCEKMVVPIIPKSYVPYIPIHFNIENKSEIVLIDDDALIRTLWAVTAREAELHVSTYASIEEFNKVINHYSKTTKIYIDSQLDGLVRGEHFAKELYSLGFTDLHLTTGYDQKKFQNIPWIKSVIGKEPPFLLV